MYCPKCGFVDTANAVYCTKCGTRMISSPGAKEVGELGTIGVIYSIVYGISVFLPIVSSFFSGGLMDISEIAGFGVLIFASVCLFMSVASNYDAMRSLGVTGIIFFILLVIYITVKNESLLWLLYFKNIGMGFYGLLICPIVLFILGSKKKTEDIPGDIGRLFSFLYLASVFMPLSSLYISDASLFSKSKIIGIIAIVLAIISIIASLLEVDLAMRIVGITGSIFFVLALIAIILGSFKFSLEYVLKILGVGTFGLMLCPLSIWLCGIAIHNNMVQRLEEFKAKETAKKNEASKVKWICPSCHTENLSYVGTCKCGYKNTSV